jgi:hypothetical protein
MSYEKSISRKKEKGKTTDPHIHLIDGQHRLHAIIQANVPIKSYVVRSITKEAFSVLDSGIKRTMGDEFTFAGEMNAIALAAGLHQLRKLEVYPRTIPRLK